jgi:hypothetical protein
LRAWRVVGSLLPRSLVFPIAFCIGIGIVPRWLLGCICPRQSRWLVMLWSCVRGRYISAGAGVGQIAFARTRGRWMAKALVVCAWVLSLFDSFHVHRTPRRQRRQELFATRQWGCKYIVSAVDF